MAKIILSESQVKRLIENRLNEQPMLSSLSNSPGYLAGFAAGKAAAEKARVDAVNKPLVTPGTKPSDYFLNPDGTVKVTDLDPVTVTAKRIQPNRPPLPQVKANVPGVQTPTGDNSTLKTVDLPGVTVTGEKGPAPAIAGAKPIPLPQVNPNTPGVQGTSSVSSGPTNPQAQATATKPSMSGEQMHNLLMQKGLINGFNDLDGYENRRIVYKGAPLSPEQLNTLSTYLQDKGYGKRFSQVGDKRYGQKYVWVKGGSALPSDMAV